MATAEEMKNQMAAKKNNSGAVATDKPKTIEDYLKQMAPAMSQALPKHMDVDRLLRLTMTTIRTTPELKKADPGSLLGGVMQAAQLGLEPGLLGQCYLLPFKNNKKGITEVQFIIGYKGMIDLARRSGHIQSIYAHAVYENDAFEYELGLNPTLKHTPTMDEDKGEFIGSYAVAHFKDGGYQMEFMPKSEIEKRRTSSPGGRSKYSPWNNFYEEMANKTVIRHMWKYLPISVELQEQVANDEGTARSVKDITPDDDIFIDAPDYINAEATEGVEESENKDFPIDANAQ
ncbi:recombination and repair protein RecT [Oceanobacillus oncorhynchi]|uniref:Recombination and repair protein RecT n=1 Tax=Oceanobacillus oncorhynchi TaxID=545501 RepID=A0A0A1MN98_9BACI|nr:recombination protein RecT [Oceanobacillus oncorhynchi]CEI81264.1 recombination and repair protein RecT [Oceanobacillus oncorhynchi]